MNSDTTIAKRMYKAGLPYEITNSEAPNWIAPERPQVVAIWRDSQNDNERAFVGYPPAMESPAIAEAAKRLRGVMSVYVVSARVV